MGGTQSELIASYQRLLDEGAIDGVALVAADTTSCAACTAIADRVYAPRKLPTLPVETCSRVGGCRCRYEPSVTVVE